MLSRLQRLLDEEATLTSMGSLRFNGVRFSMYSEDHLPPHVHAVYGGLQVIVELLAGGDVRLARRKDAVQPGNGSRADVSYVLRLADLHWDALLSMWTSIHGEAPWT